MTGKERKEIQTAYKAAVLLGHRLIIFRKDRDLFFAAKRKLLELLAPLNLNESLLVQDSLTDAAINNLNHLCGLSTATDYDRRADKLILDLATEAA